MMNQILNNMFHLIMSLLGIAAAVIFYSMLANACRSIIALLKGDEAEFDRLTTSYEEAAHMAVMSYGRLGVTREIFEKYWQRELKRNSGARPLDAYHSIMEELAITNEPDPTIWS